MRVLLIADMEGISRITDHRECWPAFPAYWEHGRQLMTDDVVSAAEGLREGGATRVIVHDGHGTGDWQNLLTEQYSDHVQSYSGDEEYDFALLIGCHARCGTSDGFISHTNVPEFRIKVNGALVTECHEDAWRAGVPLLGVIGDAALGRQLDGSLEGVPFLAVKQSRSRTETVPCFPGQKASAHAICEFSRHTMSEWRTRQTPSVPKQLEVAVSMRPDLTARVDDSHGWERASDAVLVKHCQDFQRDIRPALNAARAAAIQPWIDAQGDLDLRSHDALERQDSPQLERMRDYIVHWMQTNYSEWVN